VSYLKPYALYDFALQQPFFMYWIGDVVIERHRYRVKRFIARLNTARLNTFHLPNTTCYLTLAPKIYMTSPETRRNTFSMKTLGLDVDRFEVLEGVEGDHFWFVARRELIVGLLRQHVPSKVSDLLDMGCGPGMNLKYWTEFATHVVGVDQHISKSTKSHSGDQTYMPTVIDGDVTGLPIDLEKVDITLLLDVLEHVDDKAALAEAYRVLRPGGLLLLSVPAHPWLWGARDSGASHLRRYTAIDLRKTVQNAGFAIEKIRPYQFLLLPAVILSRVLGKFTDKTRDIEDHPTMLVNRICKWINRTEVRASLSLGPMPTGSSYILVARKPVN
jgi:SAM-dependent methyltransferase